MEDNGCYKIYLYFISQSDILQKITGPLPSLGFVTLTEPRGWQLRYGRDGDGVLAVDHKH